MNKASKLHDFSEICVNHTIGCLISIRNNITKLEITQNKTHFSIGFTHQTRLFPLHVWLFCVSTAWQPTIMLFSVPERNRVWSWGKVHQAPMFFWARLGGKPCGQVQGQRIKLPLERRTFVCLVKKTDHSHFLKVMKENTRAGNMAEWQNAFSACLMGWVGSPAEGDAELDAWRHLT